MQIINIDDDSDDRYMFCMAISRIDPEIECIQVDCGEDAVELLKDSKMAPDFIFMDINMPRMNGYECLREIYLLPNIRNTTIVMFSSTFNPKDRVEFSLFRLQYLLKTSDRKSLVESLRRLVELKLAEGKLQM
jgi:CheY-like chemotaxis protein